MSEMVERVARALCEKRCFLQELKADDLVFPGSVREIAGKSFMLPRATGAVPIWTMFEWEARAAIAAMREPTEAMLAATTDCEGDPCWYCLNARAHPSSEANAADCWQAMIDAALK